MMHDDFEAGLRSALATLAREAVPHDSARPVDDLPRVQSLDAAGRPIRTRVLAAVLAVAVAFGIGVIALVRHNPRTPKIETPQPVWTRVAASPLGARADQMAVFAGRQVIVWGGRSASEGNVASARAPKDSLADGAAYNLASGRWSGLPVAPIGARYGAVAAWTGKEMLVVGGSSDGTAPSGGVEFLRDGAAYDPAHHRWRRIPDAPGCPLFGTWTGRELVVGGYCNGPGPALVMAAYDPARNAWTALPPFPNSSQLIAAGGRVFAWGSSGRGAVLDRAARRWTALPALPAPGRAYRQSTLPAAYAGHLAVASLLQRPSEDGDHAGVDIFDLGTRSWRHYESAIRPASDGMEIAAAGDALEWSDELSYNWFVQSAPGAPKWSSAGPGPVEVAGVGGSLVPIGNRRFFVWGGRLAGTEKDPTNRPTREGVIIQLP
jgi:hypothetical protein